MEAPRASRKELYKLRTSLPVARSDLEERDEGLAKHRRLVESIR
ncbi:MAG: hypothetical protein WBM08_08495 [Prochlorococcaceae cyanobacterium]